jgi:hypothetical protein
MKLTPLFAFALALLAGGVSAAVTASLLSRPEKLEPDAPASASIVTRAQLEQEVETRTRKLVAELAELEERLTLAERRPVGEARQPASGFASQEDLRALREELLALIEQEAPGAARSEEFKLKVSDALSAIRKEERVEKVRAGQEQAAGNVDGQVEKIGDWLALDAYQRQQLREELTAKHERDAELIQLWEAGTDTAILGEMKQTNRELDREAMEAILTPQQLETYREATGGRGKK